MPPRTTPLLSNKAPLVNAGEIALPVLTSVGEWAHLTATPTQWQKIIRDLAGPLGLEIVTAGSGTSAADPRDIAQAVIADGMFETALTNALRRANKAAGSYRPVPVTRELSVTKAPITKPGTGRIL